MRDREPVPRRFVQLDGADAVELSYRGGRLAMWLIVPRDPTGLATVEESLNSQDLTGLGVFAQQGFVDLTMPKWEQTLPPTDLFEWLCPLGFCAGAPFENIAPQIMISAALHGAKVIVDEKGTEAAAATAMAFDESAGPQADLTVLCPGCVPHGLPQAMRIQQVFGDALTVLGLHCVFEHHEAMTPASLEAFLYEYRITFPVGVDAHDGQSRLSITMGRYQPRGTPSLVVVDRAGRLRLNAFGQINDLAVGATLARLIDDPRPQPADDCYPTGRELIPRMERGILYRGRSRPPVCSGTTTV